MNAEWIASLIGGLIIGLAVSVMLITSGRVTGISGIIYGILNPKKGDVAWRVYFIGGLILGGLVYKFFSVNQTSEIFFKPFHWTTAIAGLLVGYGTVLGSGCTSGHGVCGISRMSIRSLIATLLFIFTGIATVWMVKHFGVSL